MYTGITFGLSILHTSCPGLYAFVAYRPPAETDVTLSMFFLFSIFRSVTVSPYAYVCVCVCGVTDLGAKCAHVLHKSIHHYYYCAMMMITTNRDIHSIYSMYLYTSMVAPEEEYKDHRHSMGFRHTIFEFWPFCSGRQNDNDGWTMDHMTF